MSSAPPRFHYARLIAPAVLVLFAIGWYRFSEVYIQGANNQLITNDNYAVYVPLQQINGYLTALLDATYITVAIGLIILAYNLVKFVRFRRIRASL